MNTTKPKITEEERNNITKKVIASGFKGIEALNLCLSLTHEVLDKKQSIKKVK
mgnify:CR=1 FL=1